MKPTNRFTLLRIMRQTLSASRFRHSLSVARLAEKLGKIHGWNSERAFCAGLLHDCVKEWTPQELAIYARKKKLIILVSVQ
jgi:nicotinate-nucleotide adenylyltransferase